MLGSAHARCRWDRTTRGGETLHWWYEVLLCCTLPVPKSFSAVCTISNHIFTLYIYIIYYIQYVYILRCCQCVLFLFSWYYWIYLISKMKMPYLRPLPSVGAVPPWKRWRKWLQWSWKRRGLEIHVETNGIETVMEIWWYSGHLMVI